MLGRYLVWQAPGWLVVAAAALGTAALVGLPWWLAALATGLFVVKDLALYPAMRAVFRAPAGPRPIGARAEVTEALTPIGWVRVDSELWKARARGGEPVPAGRTVRVVAAAGLTLIVEPE